MVRKPRIVRVTELAQRPPEGALAVPIGHGWTAWVDAEDWALIEPYTWILSAPQGIAYALGWRPGAGGRQMLMHRLILGAPSGVEVDHRFHREDLKVVDNRRSNLRLASSTENSGNRRLRRNPTASIFKGLTQNSPGRRRPWIAEIRKDHVRHCLGTFTSEGLAALAYDLAAVKLYGDRALTNFPVPGSVSWIYG